jgi:hypothetical protein
MMGVAANPVVILNASHFTIQPNLERAVRNSSSVSNKPNRRAMA